MKPVMEAALREWGVAGAHGVHLLALEKVFDIQRGELRECSASGSAPMVRKSLSRRQAHSAEPAIEAI